jgi:hypothetical protein
MVTVEQGPTEHVVLLWFHYFTQRDNVLTSVVVDLTFGAEELDSPLDWCTIVRVTLRHPTEAGWTNHTESEVLGRLEEELENAANDYQPSLVDKLLRRSTKLRVRSVGRETAGGVQKLYFYGTAPIPASVFEHVLAAPEFDTQQWSREVFSSKDKDESRSFYTGSLHPGAALRWLILTDSQLKVREEEGDDLGAEREVDHELSFPDEESRRRFVEALVEVSGQEQWTIVLGPVPSPEEPGRFHVTVSHEQSVNKLWADVFVTALSSRAESFGGDYEGWGALVIAEEIKRLTSGE